MSIISHEVDKEEEESDTRDEDLPGPEVLSACGHFGNQGWWLYLWTSRQRMLAP
jgi:hypothetical protein